MIQRWSMVVAGAVGWLALTACRDSGPEEPGVLAKVGSEAVTEETFRAHWQQRSVADTEENREELLEKLIDRALLVEAARGAGVDREPAIQAALEGILISRLKEKELSPMKEAVRVSEEEVRAFYETHKAAQYMLPERLRAAVLWFSTNGQQPLEERYRHRLQTLRDKLTATRSDLPPVEDGFGRLAITNSEHRASRNRGGDTGWLQSSPEGVQTDPWRGVVWETASKLSAPGNLSEVIVNDEGVFLVRLIESREAEPVPFDKVRGSIEGQLLRERRASAEERFIEGLRERFAIERFPERVHEIEVLGDPVEKDSL